VRIGTVNLNFRCENMSPVTQKIREDGIVTSRPVYSKYFFRNNTKQTAICVIARGKEEVNQLAKHF